VKCPVCPDSTLVISAREGVEIDHCPQCRGVWLDRGELDKILDRTLLDAPQPQQARSMDRDDRWYPSKRHKKKESMLERFFDFD
jgi:Zn-finger nucleic acid-binding protein